jgi:hypothetical protein
MGNQANSGMLLAVRMRDVGVSEEQISGVAADFLLAKALDEAVVLGPIGQVGNPVADVFQFPEIFHDGTPLL